MPIEIKELYIKINVNDSAQTNAAPSGNNGDGKDKLMSNVVEKIMEIQDRKNER